MKETFIKSENLGFDVDSVLAKSNGKSLFAHIEDCLKVYQNLCRALPTIPIILGQDNFFDLLFCSIYLHDWGKAHIEFQKLLKGQKNQWLRSRHEIYSIPFVEMLPFEPKQKELIAQSILGHHKDFETLMEYLYSDEQIEEYNQTHQAKVNPLDFKDNLKNKLNISYLIGLKNHFQAMYDKYAKTHRHFDFISIDFSSQENPINKYAKPFLKKKYLSDQANCWLQMLLSGSIKLCDHMGSGEQFEITRLSGNEFKFLNRFEGNWYSHQEKCAEVKGSLLLIAPTGSGKTEAALRWIQNQLKSGHQGRVFYVLPFTASINAMHQRFVKSIEGKNIVPSNSRYVGILHGKVDQYIAQFFEDLEDDRHEYKDRLKKIKEIQKQMVHPLKVVTPFQILKYCYGVKGFEKGLTELAGAMLIFDEIHAYDTQTFAQIVVSLKWLSEHLATRALIMTATLPSFMLEELQEAVGSSVVVRADEQLLRKLSRHHIHILEGSIFDQISLIDKSLKEGKRIVVVCNTVASAQKLFNVLTDKKESPKSILLHSRFIPKDRIDKEQCLNDGNVQLLVGTQVIEVSLDIDFDVIFTEPAPLDALIQRFGRVNRRCKKGISPVWICKKGGEYDHYIYPKEIVENTLSILKNTSIMEETQLQSMLDNVYPDWADKKKYEEIKRGFLLSLNRLKPFTSFKEEERTFYERFTGVSVLPIAFQEKYEECISDLDFSQAENYFINIHLGMFHKMLKQGLLERELAIFKHNDKFDQIPYWVVKCKYDTVLGLMENEEEQGERSTVFF
ncbi:MAG: CRISPR-associated helicase Cas3' [Thermodesulfobacteriota bacterium]|nr:CRISPR-associated helicase Cas3' [Thermodesulfobacteriota bacterium]